jgi:hypothetical protein
MPLNDKILSEYFDENNNFTETKRNEIIDKISKNLSEGSGNIISFLKDKLQLDDEFIKNNLPEFGGNQKYSNGEIDLKDKNKFPQFHNEYIDKLFKSLLLPLNIPGQTPLIALGIFDPTGLLPDFEGIKNQILQTVPAELRNTQFKFPLTLIQLGILGGVTDELIAPVFSQLGLLNVKLVDLKNFDTNQIVTFLTNKVEIPAEFSFITDKEKYIKLIFGSLKSEDLPNPAVLDEARKKIKDKFQDFIVKLFRDKIKSFISPEILLQTFPFPPPLPIPPVTLPFDILNTITQQLQSLQSIVPIPALPLEFIKNLDILKDTIVKNKEEILKRIKTSTGETPTVDEIITNSTYFRIANDVIPLVKVDTDFFINDIKNIISDIVSYKISKYTEILKLPILIIGQIFSKVDTILNFITDFSTNGIPGLLKNFFSIISSIISPYFAEKNQNIKSLKDLTGFQAAIALTLITTLISTVLSIIIGSIFGKGQITNSILNFF